VKLDKINLIIRNDASDLFFLAYLAGRPATARQADDVPIAIGRSTGNASVYHILSRFLPFTGAIADKHFMIKSIWYLFRKNGKKSI
jgi:hypothetical protein